MPIAPSHGTNGKKQEESEEVKEARARAAEIIEKHHLKKAEEERKQKEDEARREMDERRMQQEIEGEKLAAELARQGAGTASRCSIALGIAPWDCSDTLPSTQLVGTAPRHGATRIFTGPSLGLSMALVASLR